MPTLTKTQQDCPTVFSLYGTSEDSASYALGWVLLQSPHLMTSLLVSLGCTTTPDIVKRTEILLQAHHKNGGFSDLELLCEGEFHLIFEAKKYWTLPDDKQLLLYASRFNAKRTPLCKMITVSAASEEYATMNQKPDLGGHQLSHLSWTTLRSMCSAARAATRSSIEKLWLAQLYSHLKEYQIMTSPNDNRALCVVLSSAEIKKGTGYTYIDVVEQDSKYFHPVNYNGWPSAPANYMAFRKKGKLVSVHHVKSYEIVADLNACNPNWPSTNVNHFIYSLGPAITPQTVIKNGPIRNNQRVWCAIDTLLSGAFNTVWEARNETQRRMNEA